MQNAPIRVIFQNSVTYAPEYSNRAVKNFVPKLTILLVACNEASKACEFDGL